MNLGHGRAGHLPDYSYARYRYMPAWGGYREIVKDNPSDYLHAFRQMIYALRYLKGEEGEAFQTETYDERAYVPYREEIEEILAKRQLDASKDWKAFGERLSKEEIPDFAETLYQEEYRNAAVEEKENTMPGQFIRAALAQKSMVTNRIFSSGSLLAGFSVDYAKKGFHGIPDFRMLLKR